jgi:LysM repeat protein
LLLQPESTRAPLVKERIRGCKQELANSEFPLPKSRNLQHEVDQLTTENHTLKQQMAALSNQLAAVAAAAPVRIEQTRALPAATPVVAKAEPSRSTEPAPAHARVHIVKSHETISSIAAGYGMKASAILAANPQTDPRRLHIGQSLNLP